MSLRGVPNEVRKLRSNLMTGLWPSSAISKDEIPRSARNDKRKLKLSRLRRFVMLGIVILFLLQFLRVKVLIGSLSGSLVLWFINLIDVFAFFESLAASKDFTATAVIAVIPLIGIYLIFGRAFCGWVCPMDFLYEMVDKIRGIGHGFSENRLWGCCYIACYFWTVWHPIFYKIPITPY